MKPSDANNWQSAVLDEVFVALAGDTALTEVLIFKGARILAQIIPEAARQSLDLDANCTKAFLAQYPDRQQQAEVLARQLRGAIHRHFEAQTPVRYQLDSVQVLPRPPKGHPRGWNALQVQIRVLDMSRPSVRGLPTLGLDLAYPEALSEHSTTQLEIVGRRVMAYTLERIAGEKLRAFLSTTPAYQQKKAGSRETLRVKDLPDLAQILKHTPLTDRAFWRQVGAEFRLACESRGIDCSGWATFDAVEEQARGFYAKDSTVAGSMAFDDAWKAVKAIVKRMEVEGITPFEFALPPLIEEQQ